MWERKGNWRDRQEPQPQSETPPPPPPQAAVVPPPNVSRATNQASLGESLHIKGEISGSEDLIVHGRFEGRIDLQNHNLTIGQNGQVEAELRGRTISIQGQVNGNIVAEEKVELAGSGQLLGDITAPRFAMEDGTQFRGRVDMGKVIPDHPED